MCRMHKCRGHRDAQERPMCRMHKCRRPTASCLSPHSHIAAIAPALLYLGTSCTSLVHRERTDAHDSMDAGGRIASGTAIEEQPLRR
jgi:hypothetical protein